MLTKIYCPIIGLLGFSMLCLVSLSQLFSGAIWKPFDGKFDGPFGIALVVSLGQIWVAKWTEVMPGAYQ